MATAAGVKLAWKLNPALGSTHAIDETCSLIVRLATGSKSGGATTT